jgi:hypothetical protein
MKIYIKISKEAADKAVRSYLTRKEFLEKLREMQGTEQEVEMEHLFEDQFNLKELRILWFLCDSIRYEGLDVTKHLEMVQARYDKDWQGRKVNEYFIRKLAGDAQ